MSAGESDSGAAFSSSSEAQKKADLARKEALLRLPSLLSEVGGVKNIEAAGKLLCKIYLIEQTHIRSSSMWVNLLSLSEAISTLRDPRPVMIMHMEAAWARNLMLCEFRPGILNF